MKQLLLKEWREHFKVALAALAVFAVLLVLFVRSGTGQLTEMASGAGGAFNGSWMQPLVCPQLLVVCSVFCAIFGVILGWLQIHAERHPDLRAFLLHRPIEPATILAGKLLSGAGLYALAAGGPLLGLVIYAVLPGDVAAPFECAMLLPVCAVFLLGLVFYGAGLLTGLRSARWYGSRIFGLGPALLAAVCVFAVPEFWQALVLILIAGAMVFVAVWAAFPTGGFYRDQTRPGKLALSLICALTGLILCGLAMALLASALIKSRSYRVSDYQLNQKGEVYRVTEDLSGPVTIVDLQGRPVVDEKTGETIKREDFYKQVPTSLRVSVNFKHPRPGQARGWSQYNNNLRYFVPWQIADKTFWYLNRQGQLVGYNGATRRQVATLKADDGFQTGFNWPEAYYNENNFQPANQHELLATDKTLYLTDLQNRLIKPLLATTNADGIGGFTEEPNQHEVLVVTRNFIREFNLDGGTRVQVPFVPGWAGYSEITLAWLTPTNHFALEFMPTGGLNELVEWVTSDGTILRSQKLPKLPGPDWQDDVAGKNLCLVFPPVTRFVAAEVIKHSGGHYQFDKWDAWSFVPGLLSALVGWGMGRRYNFSLKDQAGWGVFHILFGVPGLLAFFSVQEWPAREPCPKCQKLRLVENEQCEHCGAAFAPPERNGTEIFETERVAANRSA
jgi:ABC-type transport system involved in multi-copper enzyme maturation permease subunit